MKKENNMKKLLTISMCVATLFMTACGNTQDTSNGSSKSTKISGEMTFGDYINSSGRKIFYQFSDDNFSKDTYIHRISVIEDQQITSYAIEELTFADLQSLSDDEIIAKAKELHAQYVENKLEPELSGIKATVEHIEEVRSYTSNEQDLYGELSGTVFPLPIQEKFDAIENGESTESITDILNTYTTYAQNIENSEEAIQELQQPSPTSYTIGMYTDDSGNKTQTEYLKFEALVFSGEYAFKEKRLTYDDYLESKPLKTLAMSSEKYFSGFINFITEEVYDSTYLVAFNSDSEYVWATKTNGELTLTLDQPDTKIKNVEIDEE